MAICSRLIRSKESEFQSVLHATSFERWRKGDLIPTSYIVHNLAGEYQNSLSFLLLTWHKLLDVHQNSGVMCREERRERM